MHKTALLALVIVSVFGSVEGCSAAASGTCSKSSIKTAIHSSCVQCDRGNFVAAEYDARRALKLAQCLAVGHRLTAQCFLQMAHVLELEGKYRQAEVVLRKTLAIHRRYCERELLAVDNILLADIFRQQGRYKEARPLLIDSIKVLSGKAAFAPQAATAVNNLGALYYWLGNDSRAADLLERAVQARERICGKDHPWLANSLADLAVVYIRIGRKADGKELLDRALAVRTRIFGSHPQTATTLGNLGAYYLDCSDMARAESYYQRACRIMERWPKHPERANYLVGLAAVYAKVGKFDQAEALCQTAFLLQTELFGANTPLIAKTFIVFGNCKVDEGKFDEAPKFLERALLMQERLLDAHNPSIAQTLEGLGDCYFLDGQIARAENMYQRALYIRRQLPGDKLPVALDCNNLANCYLEQGKLTDAAALYKQALALAPVKTIEENYQRCLAKLSQNSQQQCY